jgi:hypothetical protein
VFDMNSVSDLGLRRRARTNVMAIRFVVAIAALAAAACSKPKAEPAGASPARLWGDLKPVVSVKELMRDMLDPIADNIFDSVKIVETANGVEESLPKTDEDWEKVRIGGTTIAEGVYLLKIPRPFAPAGDLNNSTGPDAVELSPAQILAKVQQDPVEWNARIEALRNVGLEVLDLVKRRDAKELWDASDNLDQACENCHRSYWYPGEDAHFYEKLNRRAAESARKNPSADGRKVIPDQKGK